MWTIVIGGVAVFIVGTLLLTFKFRSQARLADKMSGETMEPEEHPSEQVVFVPSQCEAEVNELIDKFTGIESNLDLSELKALIDESTHSDKVTKAIQALKLHMVLPEQQHMHELSVEQYVVEIESVMREYVSVIMSASQQGHDAVHKTEQLLKQIDSIFSLVDGLRHIADQTGLLALNAAIEAAKTGDVGRSYSYMAKEVQRLSAQSENFGGDIKAEMQKAKSSVETTTALVDQMVISDLQIALETRSSVDQLIGQLQGLAVTEIYGFKTVDVYNKIFMELHKIVVVVLMKIDLIQRLGLVDQQFQQKLAHLNTQLKSLYLTKVLKK